MPSWRARARHSSSTGSRRRCSSSAAKSTRSRTRVPTRAPRWLPASSSATRLSARSTAIASTSRPVSVRPTPRCARGVSACKRRKTMSYVRPEAVLDQMVALGHAKAELGVKDLLVRGILAGSLLGFATTLAFTGTLQTKVGLVGALVFPVGFVMIVLLGLELVTGNFALVPLGVMDGKITMANLWFNWSWVFLGNLV